MREKLDQLLERLGGRRRAAILGAGVGAVLLILGISWWATAPEWVPVYSGVPLESVGPMTERLGEEKVRYRLAGNGQDILVPAPELARARVALAQGGLPLAGRPGMELFDQPSWGMTDFTQRINYRRALEGELERTIGKMRGVEAAQVHLAIQESSSFRRPDGPGRASVVLKLRGGQRPDREVVRGIQHLVAGSVGGIQSEHVTILDDAGRLLSAPSEGGAAMLTHRQLEMQREVEQHLEQKASELLAQVVGAGNARVQVAAEINFDRVERTSEIVDPDGQVAVSEQVSEIIPGPQGGAGSRTNATTYNSSRRLESFSGSVGGIRRLTVAVLVNGVPAEGSNGTQLVSRPPAELQQLQTLVERAVGFDAARGDQVSVVSMPFVGAAPAPGGSGTPVTQLVHDFARPVLTLLALLLAFVVALKVIRTLRPVTEADGPALAAPAAAAALPGAAAPDDEEAGELPTPRPARALPTTRDHVATVVSERPELAARLVRSWLQESSA